MRLTLSFDEERMRLTSQLIASPALHLDSSVLTPGYNLGCLHSMQVAQAKPLQHTSITHEPILQLALVCRRRHAF